MKTITIPEDTTIQYESLSFVTSATSTFEAQVLSESNGFMRCIDPDGDVFHVKTRSLPGRDSSLYPHPDAPCWACKTVAEADAKMAKIKDHHYNMDVRHRDHHALAMAELRYRNTVARLTDKSQHSQPASTATEDEVSTDDADTPDTPNTDWTTDPDEIGRTLGIPAPLILPAPHQPAPTKRDQQPKEEAVSHTPAKTSPAVVPSVDPISDMRVVRDADDAPSVIVPSSNGRGEYRVRLAWGCSEHPEPVSCTCKHYTCRIAPKVRRSLRYGAEEVPEDCKHMRQVRFAILHGHLDGVTPYRLVALAA